MGSEGGVGFELLDEGFESVLAGVGLVLGLAGDVLAVEEEAPQLSLPLPLETETAIPPPVAEPPANRTWPPCSQKTPRDDE